MDGWMDRCMSGVYLVHALYSIRITDALALEINVQATQRKIDLNHVFQTSVFVSIRDLPIMTHVRTTN